VTYLSKVYTCDICNNITPSHKISKYTKTTMFLKIIERFDICDDCINVIKHISKVNKIKGDINVND
jgi:hypothetical protein